MKYDKIRYYDRNRITKYYMRDVHGNSIYTDFQYNVQDTGYSFYEDVKANHWNIMNLHLSDVCIHYKEASSGGQAVYNWLYLHHDLF